MKICAICDEGLKKKNSIGYLFYYEKSHRFIMELEECLDEWEAPLLFTAYVKKNIYTIPAEVSERWVRERIIPSGRQNIGMILKNHKMKEYDEMKLLQLSKGRSSQDACYIKEIEKEEVPQEIWNRMKDNVTECFLSEGTNLICFFRDNSVRKIDLQNLVGTNGKMEWILRNEQVMQSVKVGVGGYSIVFNDSVEIGKQILLEKGIRLGVTAQDFLCFVQKNLLDSTETCERLQCTKQNLTYLIKKKKLQPVHAGLQENLFSRGNVEKNMWD